MINRRNIYFKQAELLVRILPFIESESCFAVKGGTAINLFIRDLPRISVDIDLVYLPIKDRITSLNEMDSALMRIGERVKSSIRGLRVTPSVLSSTNKTTKLIFELKSVRIKLEVNPVLRGTVFPPELLAVKDSVSELIGYAESRISSFPDLYAGKICAALDRQHPRDLFDIRNLLDNEGITKDIFNAFLVYLISHSRPISEILMPNFIDISKIFSTEFKGMTVNDVKLDDLYTTREELVGIIREHLNESDKKFLISFKSGNPDWNLLDIDVAKKLPAVNWKLQNIKEMVSKKRVEALDKLERVLYS